MERSRPTKGIPQRRDICEPSMSVSTAQAGDGIIQKTRREIRMVKREMPELNTNYLLSSETCNESVAGQRKY